MNKPLAGVILVVSAGLLGWIGVTLLVDSETADGSAVPAPAVAAPKMLDLSPHERRLERRLEKAKQEIEDYKKQGEVLENGAIKVKDVDGTPLYVLDHLVEGVGRYGEPLYAMVKYKRRAPAPMLANPPGNESLGVNPNPVRKAKKQWVNFATKPGEENKNNKRKNKTGKGKKQ